jgi:hypothetical protein
MVEKIEKWRTKDGLEFDTEDQADRHESDQDAKEQILVDWWNKVSHQKHESILKCIWKNRHSLALALKRIDEYR